MSFVWISQQTAIISLYSIILSVFKTEAECLLRGTNWVFKSDRYSFVLKGLIHMSSWCAQGQFHHEFIIQCTIQIQNKAVFVPDTDFADVPLTIWGLS